MGCIFLSRLSIMGFIFLFGISLLLLQESLQCFSRLFLVLNIDPHLLQYQRFLASFDLLLALNFHSSNAYADSSSYFSLGFQILSWPRFCILFLKLKPH